MVAAVPADVLAKIKARIPVGRLGHASEIARGVVFLTADDAGFVTGSTLRTHGGQNRYCCGPPPGRIVGFDERPQHPPPPPVEPTAGVAVPARPRPGGGEGRR